MTCDDYRTSCANGRSILQMTAAERVAVAQHWVNCEECQRWTNDEDERLQPQPMTADEAAKILELAQADNQDPEAAPINMKTAEDTARKYFPESS